MLVEIEKAVRKKAPKNEWDDMQMVEGANGDILYGHEYIQSVVPKKDFTLKNVIPLPSNFGNRYGWSVLEYYIDSKSIVKLMEESNYQCPFQIINTFFWNVPIGILYTSQENFDWYKSRLSESSPTQSEFLFSDFVLEDLTLSKLVESMSDVTKSMLGHGYTDGTLPCDGDGNITFTYMPLSNGDKLICASWEWFNK